MPAGPLTSTDSSTLRCILYDSGPHAPDRLNLVVERLPIVVLRDGRPDAFYLVDVHRTGRGAGPIFVRGRAGAAIQQSGQCPKLVFGIKVGTGIASAAP